LLIADDQRPGLLSTVIPAVAGRDVVQYQSAIDGHVLEKAAGGSQRRKSCLGHADATAVRGGVVLP
jgi:hypothetical protein